jgi:DNA-binding XRE family transcriptional regulator
MTPKEFSLIRHQLEKTQVQLAQLLGTSQKAVQSFEQGWRSIPVHIERQMFLLLSMKLSGGADQPLCWETEQCPPERKEHCPAWEFKCGRLCWFINGTVCGGTTRATWTGKMKICRKCEVFKPLLVAMRER